MDRVSASISRSAISHNCRVLGAKAGDASTLCAVVKADGYGHGVELAADAAVQGGAQWLAVAAAPEALELRDLGRREPILVMGAVSAEELAALVAADCDVAVWSSEAVDLAAATGRASGHAARLHVKLDSGMGRLGTRDAGGALGLVRAASEADGAEAVGVMTHFATADEADDTFLREQLELFSKFRDAAVEVVPSLIAHAANSAATLKVPAAAFDMVRCGVGIYGLDPFGVNPANHDLRPALEWTSWVAAVKPLLPGQSVGYGRRFVAEVETRVATVPIGYADGFHRAYTGVDALVGGVRSKVVGTVSMDNITINLGPESTAKVGDEVVLIGRRGNELMLAEHLASAADTINYEVATSVGGRTQRHEVA